VAAERETPVDEETGLLFPYSIFTASDDRGIKKTWNDWHHGFSPRNDVILAETDGGVFLRDSRLQLVPRWLHERYHQIYTGPPIPTTGRDQLLIGILAVAGYLPDFAIDVTKSAKNNHLVRIDKSLRRQMSAPDFLKHGISKDINMQRYARIGRFMMAEVLNQNISSVDERGIEEFLETKNQETRIRIGREIIKLLIERATEPIEPIYDRAYKSNRLATTHIRRASGIIKVVTSRHHPDYIDDLHQKILEPEMLLTYS